MRDVESPVDATLQLTVPTIRASRHTIKERERGEAILVKENLGPLAGGICDGAVDVFNHIGVNLKWLLHPVEAVMAVRKPRHAVPVMSACAAGGIDVGDHFEHASLVSPNEGVLPNTLPWIAAVANRATFPWSLPA